MENDGAPTQRGRAILINNHQEITIRKLMQESIAQKDENNMKKAPKWSPNSMPKVIQKQCQNN